MNDIKQNDGGPAFPHSIDSSEVRLQFDFKGMSLRDWFAGQALSGMLADSRFSGKAETYAELSYELADAMLKAREK